MRTATHLQLFRFKCVAFVQQKYHNSISSSRGFCRFLRENAKIKISRSENVSQAQQIHPRSREFVTSVLRFTVFRIVSSHLTCCILFFHTFSAMFSCIFSVCLFAYMHISKCNRLFVCAFPFHSPPIPQPFSGLQPASGCTFCNKNSTGTFSGPSVLCRIPYIKEERLRRAALPQFRLCYKKISRQSITEQPLLPRSV